MNAPISARTSVIAKGRGSPSLAWHQWPRSVPHPGPQSGAEAIGAPVEHGPEVEQIEGMLCRTPIREKETYEWGQILYELLSTW